jgi:DNA mismatch repair protein MLH1
MDPQNRTLQSMFPVSNPSQVEDADERPSKRRATDDVVDLTFESPKAKGASAEIMESVCALTSVRDLRLAAGRGGSSGTSGCRHDSLTDEELAEIISDHTLVGLVDQYSCQSLIQHRTALYIVNHCSLACVVHLSLLISSDEHFYQLGLRQFGAFHRIKIDPPAALDSLLTIAIEVEPDVIAQGLDQKKVLKVSFISL